MKTQRRFIQRGISRFLLLVAFLPASAGLGILASPQAASAEELRAKGDATSAPDPFASLTTELSQRMKEPGESPKRRPPEEGKAEKSREETREMELADLEAYLQSRGIAVNKKGIGEYLEDLTGPRLDRAVAQKMIPQLGSESFVERRRAEEALKKLPASQLDLLREAAQNPDPEVAYRARGILEGRALRLSQAVETAIRAIRATELLKLSNLTEDIFRTADFFQNESLSASIQRALLVTVTAGDLPLLESLIDNEPALRTMAIRALAAESLSGVEGVRERLGTLWRTGDLAERLASTEILLARGDREALGQFVALLESDDAEIRALAGGRLRAVTGQPIAFDPRGPAEERAGQVAVWRTWVAESGRTAEIRTDATIRWGWDRTLVAYERPFASKDLVIEYDLTGNETWRVEERELDICWGVRTGERFVSLTTELIVYAPGDGPTAHPLEVG